MHQKRAYLYCCYPTASQRQMLARTFGCARFVYTDVLRCQEVPIAGNLIASFP